MTEETSVILVSSLARVLSIVLAPVAVPSLALMMVILPLPARPAAVKQTPSTVAAARVVPVEVHVRAALNARRADLIALRARALAPIPCTASARTLRDLASHCSIVQIP